MLWKIYEYISSIIICISLLFNSESYECEIGAICVVVDWECTCSLMKCKA